MFSFLDARADHTCAGPGRRDFLRVGGLGLGGLSLPWILQQKAAAGTIRDTGIFKDRSVVLLFLQGGPPHIECFDPSMDAPSEYRSARGEIATRHAGITFGADFPRLARLANKFSVVRSFGTANAGHTYDKVASGDNPTKGTMGSIYSRLLGANDPFTGLPSNVLVRPETVDPQLQLQSNFETNAMGSLITPGNLGVTHRAFDPSGGGELQNDLELNISADRFGDRRELLNRLDAIRRNAEAGNNLEATGVFREQAFDILSQGISKAFDLSYEDRKVFERYDTSHLFRIKDWTRFHNMKRTSNLLGQQMLLARRLCEEGCGFVSVSDCGWDLHADGNSAPGLTAMEPLGGQVDHAVAAFIEDCEARGLGEKILLVVTSEMGRSPKINKRGGRDHYGTLAPLLVYGGGLKMGQVIGQSDRFAARPVTRPYLPNHLLATVMHSLFDVAKLRTLTDLPAGFDEVLAYDPIGELV